MDEGPLIRIDIPVGKEDGGETTVTEFYDRAAIFSLRPCTEEIARTLIERYSDPCPVWPVDYREEKKALPDYSRDKEVDLFDEEEEEF